MTFYDLLTNFFQSFFALWTHYEWWGFAIAIIICVLTIPLNFLVKWGFKKFNASELERLRKGVSSVLPFGVATGVLYLYQWLFGEHLYNFDALLSDIWNGGISAMLCWGTIKLIRDVGFGKVIEAVAKSKEVKELLGTLAIDPKVSEQVLATIQKLAKYNAKNGGVSVEEYFEKHQTELQSKAEMLVRGYGIEKSIANQCGEGLVKALATKLKIKGE